MHSRTWPSFRRLIPLALAAVPLAAHTAAAQVIVGRILDASTGAALDAVTVSALDAAVTAAERADTAAASAITDADGTFRLVLPRAGTYVIRAERLAYAQGTTEAVDVGAREVVRVEIRLAIDPVPLAPLTVTDRRRDARGRLVAYFRRLDQYQKSGYGRFITREDIERWRLPRISLYLAGVPGVRLRYGNLGDVWIQMRGFGRPCRPTLYLDGLEMSNSPVPLDQLVHPDDLEGVEIYRSPTIPAEFSDTRGCGVIVAWTRQELSDRPWSWKRFLIGAAGIVVLGILALD